MISFFSFGASASLRSSALRFGARKSARPFGGLAASVCGCAAPLHIARPKPKTALVAAKEGLSALPLNAPNSPQQLGKSPVILGLFLLFVLGLLPACQPAQSAEAEPAPLLADSSQTDSLPPSQLPPAIRQEPQPRLAQFSDSLTTLRIGGYKVDIRLPRAAFKGSVIILPGYNFPKEDACQKAPLFCQTFLEAGYLLIMPEMGRSLYSSQYFPETQARYKRYPDQNWVLDSLLPNLQLEYGLLVDGQDNFLVGISTGGRGAALLALAAPERWTAVACLSGDFDQSQMPNDGLMRNFYGPYKQFSQRWETVDNVIARIDDWQTPIFIGHGGADKVVPPAQSKQLFDSLQSRLDRELLYYSAPPKAEHNYAYWGAEAKNILAFFQSLP